MMGELAMSLVKKDVSNFMSKWLSLSVVFYCELSAYDIWQAQLNKLSDVSSDDDDNVMDIFYNIQMWITKIVRTKKLPTGV